MTTPSNSRGPAVALGLVAGAALGLLVGILTEWPLAVCIVAGAALGLLVGAIVAAQPRRP